MRRSQPRTLSLAVHRTTSSLPETPAGERPRERLAAHGAGTLADLELLSLCLTNGQLRADTQLLAQRVFAETGGLAGLPALTFHSLIRLGLTETKAAAVLAAIELARRLAFAEIPRRHPLRQPAEVARYLTLTYGEQNQEVLGALFLNGRHRLLACREIYRGTLTHAAVEPRAILKEAILAGASVIVLFHTHPSGDLQPSGEDILFTRRMVEAAATVGISLQDHLILGELGRWVSLRQRGQM